MSLERLMQPSSWEKWGKKLQGKIERPQFVGFFSPQEDRAVRLVTAKEGLFCLYWLIDESDGVICDVKFQAYGPPLLLAIGEIVSELLLRKNYDQASRITTELLDQHVRDKKELPAFPKEAFPYLNQALSAIDRAVQQCLDLPFAISHSTTPIESESFEFFAGIPGWETFGVEEQQKIIEEVIDQEVRPYIELDAGGVSVLEIRGLEVLIAYEGACTTCHSSTGATLLAIQNILQARVFPGLTVIPS